MPYINYYRPQPLADLRNLPCVYGYDDRSIVFRTLDPTLPFNLTLLKWESLDDFVVMWYDVVDGLVYPDPHAGTMTADEVQERYDEVIRTPKRDSEPTFRERVLRYLGGARHR